MAIDQAMDMNGGESLKGLIHKSERENCVKLVSHNQHHEPKDIPISMIRALALVKASVRYNTIR
jgi:hypothetical protein